MKEKNTYPVVKEKISGETIQEDFLKTFYFSCPFTQF